MVREAEVKTKNTTKHRGLLVHDYSNDNNIFGIQRLVIFLFNITNGLRIIIVADIIFNIAIQSAPDREPP